MASGTPQEVQCLMEKGVVELLVEVVKGSGELSVVDQALWCLGNISGEGAENRDFVIEKEIIPRVVQIVMETDGTHSILRQASWLLSNLCRGRPAPEFQWIAPIVPALKRVMDISKNEEILKDVCWALAYISDQGEAKIQFLFEQGIYRNLVEILAVTKDPSLLMSSLRAIGNATSGSDEQTQNLVGLGVLRPLSEKCFHPRKLVRKEVCWTLSNISSSDSTTIQLMVDAGIFEKMINQLGNLRHRFIECGRRIVVTRQQCCYRRCIER